jgi:heme/copper-type cytochrome/quinol oxidase subunit 2
MKALFLLLVICTLAVLVAVAAMWWRLRRHLRHADGQPDCHSNDALNVALQPIEPEHEPVQQG